MARLSFIGLVARPLFSSRSHSHEHEELCLYLTGTGTAWVGDQAIPFRPGTLIRFPPRIPHRESSPGGTTLYFIHTDSRQPHTGPAVVHQIPPDGAVRRLLDLAHDGVTGRLAGRELFAAVEALLRDHDDRDTEPEERLHALIAGGFRQHSFEMAAAMARCGLSPDHLRRRFLRRFGMPPVRHLACCRIAEAKCLLERGLSVGDAADQVGFTDQFYFSRVFHRLAGVQPTAWKRRPRAS